MQTVIWTKAPKEPLRVRVLGEYENRDGDRFFSVCKMGAPDLYRFGVRAVDCEAK